MTLVIITKVKLKQVNSTQLKWDPTGHPLWFNDLERDLFLIIGENELRHFELSIKENLLSGGASKALQYGKIKDDAGSRQDLSRLVNYQSEIPNSFKEEALHLIEDCQGIEDSLKSGLAQYIKGFNFGGNPLQFQSPLKSYVPLEKRKTYKRRRTLGPLLRGFTKQLPNHLALKLVASLCVLAVITLYFSNLTSKKYKFLSMDSRLNIPYINKYLSQEGELTVKDSFEKSILHRTAPYLTKLDSHQYRAFEYLILNKNMNPNELDLNGRTPLYYLVQSYLSTVKHGASLRQLDAQLKVIESLLKLGLDSRLKSAASDLSAWDLSRRDPRLNELLSKYR
jgi:hypothetical protein